ncbi:MAG: alpha/beta hydrolase [Candidatus Nanopelagicales bacterium]|nr:alpha/beta hydrolase [Candidatus Nanopelagicales bacterium]
MTYGAEVMHQHWRRRIVPLATLATCLTAVVAGLSPAAAADLARYTEQPLTWTTCSGGRQCTKLIVPKDYANPAAGDIQIALSRVRHTGPDFTGSLVVNPGGPGGAGTDFASLVAGIVAPQVASQFDIVGFDPRGVAASAPVTCMTGAQTTRWLLFDPTPDSLSEQNSLLRLAREISSGCLRYSPQIAPFISTANTVRDLDIMRAALGDEKLNLLGFSYGTTLGALYAQEFPSHVGRMVLDGAVDPSLNGMQISQGQSAGFQGALVRFAADCTKRSNCPYPGDKQDVLDGFNSLLANLDQRPLPTGTYEPLNQAQAVTAFFWSMYTPKFWSTLRSALGQAERGNGEPLQQIADQSADRIGKNRYGSNQNSAFYAVSCLDAPQTPGRTGLAAAAKSWSKNAPVPELARAMSWGNSPCSFWFNNFAGQPEPVTSTTSAPIVVVGTRFDPATPYPWAVALHEQLPTSSLITFEGDGHTAYGAGSPCIDREIDNYLLSGVAPTNGKVCN